MSQSVFADFISERSWFNRRYQGNLGLRFPTFKTALNLFLQSRGQTIVETGCVRMPGDYGAGQSTILFCEFLDRYGGHIWSIDVNPANIAVCDALTWQVAHVRTLICADSVAHLQSPGTGFPERIDLLYLDSFDFPIGELLERHTRAEDPQQAFARLQATAEDEVLRNDSDLILPCQQHCLAELIAARPRFHARTVVLIDDSYLPGGGKPRLAKQQLMEWGWICLFDSQQTLWIRP